jgi:hypothetical protein
MRRRTTVAAVAAVIFGLAGGTTLALWRDTDATALRLKGAGWALVAHDGETDTDDPVIASNPENVTEYLVTGSAVLDELRDDGSAYVGIDVDGWLAESGSLAYDVGVTEDGTYPFLDPDVAVYSIGAHETCAHDGFDATREPDHEGPLSVWKAPRTPLVAPDDDDREGRDRYCLVLQVEPQRYKNTASATGEVAGTEVTASDDWSATFFDVDPDAAAVVTFTPQVSRHAPAPAPTPPAP